MLVFFLLFQRCAGLHVSKSDDGSIVPAPEWFTLYDKCASLQDVWHDKSHWFGDHFGKKSRGHRTEMEDRCQLKNGVAEQVWESARSFIDGRQIHSQSFLASADEQVMALTQGKQNQALHFIGDSVCYQQFRSLRCILEAAGWSRVEGERDGTHEAESAPVWDLSELWSRGDRSIRLTMSWRAALWQVQEVLRAGLDGQLTQGVDEIAVVGVYAHYNERSVWATELQEFKAWVQNNSANVVLRSPLPQHFSRKPDGTFRAYQCTPNSNSTDWRQTAFQEVIGTSMQTMQVFDIALPMYFAHNLHDDDCTHYCMPVLHVMNAVLSTLLSGR
jgi:hypothetical protein